MLLFILILFFGMCFMEEGKPAMDFSLFLWKSETSAELKCKKVGGWDLIQGIQTGWEFPN